MRTVNVGVEAAVWVKLMTNFWSRGLLMVMIVA